MTSKPEQLPVPSRRAFVKGLLGGMAAAGGSAGGPAPALAARAEGASSRLHATNPLAAAQPIWKLSRPKPALPYSYFWTWDHSTNWMLDDPGVLNYGCLNRYLKQPDTYITDYQRLTDLAAGLGVKGILIWGFLRDAHGGIDHAKRVTDYAAQRGIAIKPGVGTNFYGGVYYEGNHRYNLETFLARHPEALMVYEKGNQLPRGLCPSHPAFMEWLQEGVGWLFREFNIGGANLENGDFLVCHCKRCQDRKSEGAADQPEFWHHQQLGYAPALTALQDQLPSKFVTWATYSGFTPAAMHCDRPALLDRLPDQALCQWTLTGMVHQKALPLTTYLDDGAPAAALEAPGWPAKCRGPARRNVGFIHQGSQWAAPPRYHNVVSTIKEACLRAHRAGLEGVSIHGEVSSMHIPWALNYLAFSHFIHYPEDSIRAFGRGTLGQVLESEQQGEEFATLFAHWDAGTISDQQKKEVARRAGEFKSQVAGGTALTQWRFWNWLAEVSSGNNDQQTASVF